MDFVDGYEDFGAPEINVLGIAAIERLSENQVRVTYYTRRKTGNVVVAHLIWDLHRLLDHGWRPFEKLRMMILNHELDGFDGGVPRLRAN